MTHARRRCSLRLQRGRCSFSTRKPRFPRPFLVGADLSPSARPTLIRDVVAQRYGTLIPMLVRGVQALLTFQTLDAKRAEDDPARLPVRHRFNRKVRALTQNSGLSSTFSADAAAHGRWHAPRAQARRVRRCRHAWHPGSAYPVPYLELPQAQLADFYSARSRTCVPCCSVSTTSRCQTRRCTASAGPLLAG